MKQVTIPAQWLQELIALCGPEDHELRERVMKSAATAPADALATGGHAQAVERIVIDMKQAAELLDLFGGEPTEFTVMQCNGHRGPGLYAYVTEYPEDGASFLGKTDSDATPAPQAQADARDALPMVAYLCVEDSGVIDFEVIPPCTLPPGEYSLYAKNRAAIATAKGE